MTRAERGRLLASARESKGWSQVELAARVGVTSSLVNKIELGNLSGSIDTLVALAGALDIDLNLLKPKVRDASVSIAHTPSDAPGGA